MRGEGSEVGDDGQDGDAEGVFVDDGAVGEAFGAGGADKILVEDFEQAGAHEAGDDGGKGDCQGDGGQDELGGRAPAADGQPLEPEAEDENEDGAYDKHRDGQPEQGGGHGEAVGRGVTAHGGEGAEPDAAGGGEKEGESAEREGDGQGLGEDFVDAAVAVFGREAQIAADDVGEVAGELGPERSVELVFGEELGFDGGGEFALAVEGSAGGEADEEKSQGDDAKENEKKRGEAADEQLEHAWRVRKSVRRGKEKCAGCWQRSAGPADPTEGRRDWAAAYAACM